MSPGPELPDSIKERKPPGISIETDEAGKVMRFGHDYEIGHGYKTRGVISGPTHSELASSINNATRAGLLPKDLANHLMNRLRQAGKPRPAK